MGSHFRVENKTYEYTTFPREFITYKWFKPLLVIILTALLMSILQSVITVIDTLWLGDFSSVMASIDRSNPAFFEGPGILLAIGGIAAILPALFIATKIVRDRPFSSYSSSRGGWNWGAFAKCLVVALVVCGSIIVGEAFLMPDEGADGVNRFNTLGLVLCLILVPIQATAEEYAYRGLLMQTIGSWTKLPVLAMLLSAIFFAVSHSYGLWGILSVFCHGLGFAYLTRYSKGLEASSCAHIVNNMTVFILNGFGFASSAEGGVESFVVTFVMIVIYCVAIVLLDKRFGWFTSQGDGAFEFNEKYREKMMSKQQR